MKDFETTVIEQLQTIRGMMEEMLKAVKRDPKLSFRDEWSEEEEETEF